MSKIPSNIAKLKEEVYYELKANYERSRKNFLKLVEHKLGKHKKYQRVYQLHTKRRIEYIIAQKLEHPLLNQKYEVLCRNGKNLLVTRRKTTGSYIQILSWEEIFDIFMPLHVRTGHRGGDVMKKELHLYIKKDDIEYKFPTICLGYFTRVCTLCVQRNRQYSALKTLKIGVVHVIGMIPTRCDEKFRYLLIYSDKETHYIILRPLTAKTSLEIAGELYKIFTQFGPPMVLHIHGYNSSLTEKIHKSLSEICPEFRMDTEHQPSRYELPTIVTDRIQNWMDKTKCLAWEVGCYIVQAEMNNDPQMRPSKIRDQVRCTPYSLFFHTNAEHRRGDTSSTPANTDSVIDLTALELDSDETTQGNRVSKDNNVKDETSKGNRVSNNNVSKEIQVQVNQTESIHHNREVIENPVNKIIPKLEYDLNIIPKVDHNVIYLVPDLEHNVTSVIPKTEQITDMMPELRQYARNIIKEIENNAIPEIPQHAKNVLPEEYDATNTLSETANNLTNVMPKADHNEMTLNETEDMSCSESDEESQDLDMSNSEESQADLESGNSIDSKMSCSS